MEKRIFSTVAKTIDADAGVFEAMITTESPDRGGDVVRAEGAKLDNYMKNPVVLWAHDYSQPPVAKTVDMEVIPGQGIRARFQFPEPGISQQADTVRGLWAGGFLNATSIGFQPISMTPVKAGGYDFSEWELLEFSIVPVPMNAEALRLAIKTIEGIPAETADEPEGETSEVTDANTDDPSHDETEVEERILSLLNQTLATYKEILK